MVVTALGSSPGGGGSTLVLVNDNPLTVPIGGIGTLTPNNLNVGDSGFTAAQLTWSVVSLPAHGTVLKNGITTTQFTQADINNGLITYQEDGSVATSDTISLFATDPAGNSVSAAFSFIINSTPAGGVGLIGGLDVNSQLELLYLAYYNRPADAPGFAYWQGQITQAETSGRSELTAITNVADRFEPQAEAFALYPFLKNAGADLTTPAGQAGLSTLIGTVYGNLFGRVPDAGGASYWVGQITSGAVPLGEAILAIANGAAGTDVVTVRNKIAAALIVTEASPLSSAAVSSVSSRLPANVALTISASGTAIDPGTGTHVIQFIPGASADTMVLHIGGTDQITGFDIAAGDALDVRGLIAEARLNLEDVLPNLSFYLTISDAGPDAMLLFDTPGHGSGRAVAVLRNAGNTVRNLSDLTGRNAIQT